MNMRAADAMVSRAPKPMKIFPISEVWSQVELSLLASVGEGDAARTGAIATVWVDDGFACVACAPCVAGALCIPGAPCCSTRSTSLSWSEEATLPSAAGWPSAGLSAAANSVFAFADIALAVSAGTSAVSWALALAIVAGITAGVRPLASATPVSAAFLVSGVVWDDFSTALPDLRRASRFECLEFCLVVSAFEADVALSVPAAVAGNGAAKHTNSPVARINAERPLALISMWPSPHFCPPQPGMRPRGMSTPGQKKGIFAPEGAKAGHFPCRGLLVTGLPVRAGPIDVMSLGNGEPAVPIPGRGSGDAQGILITTS